MMKKKPIEIRAEKIKTFVNSYKNKGKGIKDATVEFGYCRKTIYNYLKM